MTSFFFASSSFLSTPASVEGWLVRPGLAGKIPKHSTHTRKSRDCLALLPTQHEHTQLYFLDLGLITFLGIAALLRFAHTLFSRPMLPSLTTQGD
ncbi:unnamed protein product [Cochlearia groenlandica]